MNLFPKTIDFMSDQDRDVLNQKQIERLNRIAYQLRVIFSSNPDINFYFWFSEEELGSQLMRMELSSGNCSINTSI